MESGLATVTNHKIYLDDAQSADNMSLIFDVVVERVKKAPPAEFREFAEALAGSLSSVQVAIVREVLRQEEERRIPDQGTHRRWGI